MARTDWFGHMEKMKVPYGSFFQRPEAVRVDAKRQLRRATKCHFGNDRKLPRLLTAAKIPMAPPKWLQEAIEFYKRQPEDFIPRLFTDGTYKVTGFDLPTVFEPKAVIQQAASSVVI